MHAGSWPWQQKVERENPSLAECCSTEVQVHQGDNFFLLDLFLNFQLDFLLDLLLDFQLDFSLDFLVL